MAESIAIALAGGMMGGVLMYPIGNFFGWRAHEKAAKSHRRRKAEEKRRKAQEKAKQQKRAVYDFTHDETMKFPIVEATE